MNTIEDYRLAGELPICKCGHGMSWHTGRAFSEGRWSPFWCESLTRTLSDCTCAEFRAVAR